MNFNHALFQPISGSFAGTGPQLQLGGAEEWEALSHLHGSTEPCRPNHDHYLGNRTLVVDAQKALFTVITAPGPLSEQRQGARLGLESPGSFHLCLISQAARDGEVGEGMFLEPSLGLQISRLGSDALTAQAQGLLHWLFEHQPLRLSLSPLL